MQYIHTRRTLSPSEKRVKRIWITAEEFVGGFLQPHEDNQWITGYQLSDDLQQLPDDCKVEAIGVGYNPSSVTIILSHPSWPEVPCGEEPPRLEFTGRIRQTFVDREKYEELTGGLCSLPHRAENVIKLEPVVVKPGDVLLVHYPEDRGLSRETMVKAIQECTERTGCHIILSPDHTKFEIVPLEQLKALRDRINTIIYDKENQK